MPDHLPDQFNATIHAVAFEPCLKSNWQLPNNRCEAIYGVSGEGGQSKALKSLSDGQGMRWKWAVIWTLVASIVVGTITMFVLRARHEAGELMTFQGAVIRRDADPQKQLPVANVEVTATRGPTSASTRTDASGYFKIKFPELIWPRQTVVLSFRHEDYWPLDINIPIQLRASAKKDYIAAMEELPTVARASTAPKGPLVTVASIRIRYTANFQSEENIGGASQTFQVVNQANVPCEHRLPCSPDGNWKAAIGSVTLDAGSGNEFRNVRASCIAGPCPFTQMKPNDFQNNGRTVTVAALNWSDTATFLVEAEVFRTSIASSVRHSYPVIFGQTLNFTLPHSQEGVTIEAEVNGAPMVFPLGPNLYLSWATCNTRTSKDVEESTVYRCELKPGYKF
jgi:hypothetical protein